MNREVAGSTVFLSRELVVNACSNQMIVSTVSSCLSIPSPLAEGREKIGLRKRCCRGSEGGLEGRAGPKTPQTEAERPYLTKVRRHMRGQLPPTTSATATAAANTI